MLGFGSLGEFSLADFGTPPPPTAVSLPAVTLTISAAALGVRAGRNINLPSISLELSSPAPAAAAGKHISLPAVSMAFSVMAPGLLAGKSISLPRVDLAFRFGPPRIQTGRIINLANTVTLSSDVGALGEGALAEYAIGEGEVLTQEYTRPVEFRFSAFAIGLQAGRNLNLPAPTFSIQSTVPEIDARRRKLRVLAIAS